MGERKVARLILVVDDQEDNRDILRHFLTGSGYVVIEATNGLDAVNIARRVCPDLIIMDLGMPVMDGLEAAWHLRNISETCKVPIIACTAFDKPDREHVLRIGFDELLRKPIDFGKMSSMIERLLRDD
jgi:CheY-like chemotaxis protein